jgi:peptidoglycan/xylan/chitin deacetylase (PgdA/CDA1 family)
VIREKYKEIYSENIGTVPKLRTVLRNGFLDMSYFFQSKNKKNNFIRGMYLHYVFDDQRSQFERHIKALMNIGEFITTDDFISMASLETPIDGKYFHLSFDDGLECINRNAVPILEENNIPAIIFVNTEVLNKPTSQVYKKWRKATNYPKPLKLMDWEMLKNSSLEIGAHTKNHVRLSKVSNKKVLYDEIAGCKKNIESSIKKECKYFAWPYGTMADIDKKSLECIKKAGYKASFGVFREKIVPGDTDIMRIPRHHFEPQWPENHVKYFAQGGLEKSVNKFIL